MANYEVGNLDLTIQAVSNTTISSLDEVIKRLTTVKSLLNTTTKGTESGALAGGGISKKSQTTKALNFGMGLAKLRMASYFARRLGSALGTVVQYGSDFTETLNMWQVAFRNNLDSADKFIEKMHTAYGISTKTLMENQAIYKNMLSQMGQMSEETSYALSESLTRMVLDYSSLWNVTIQSASEKFKAMLAGQIRPIRSVSGISVEEQAIYDIYKGMGGTKTMRQLTQTEKRLLRIYATFSQMATSGAIGDFSKTIEQFANQSRLMNEYWKELQAWMGIGLKELIQASGAMQYINALLITATEIVKALVISSGYKTPDFLKDMVETTEAENDAVDELQGKLLDFDKFRALEDSTLIGGIAIDEKVLELLKGYQSSLDSVTNQSQKIANGWLKLLGFTEDENGELTLVGTSLDNLIKKIKTIGIEIGAIFGGFLAYKIATFFINPLNSGLVLIIAGVALLVSGIYELINGKVINGLYMVAGAIGAIGIAISILTGNWIPLLIGAIIGALIAIGATIYKYWDEIKTGFMQLINTIVNGVVWFINKIVDGMNFLLKTVNDVSRALGGKTIEIGYVPTINWGGVGTFAQGGLPDRGSLFIAGEAGAELVTSGTNGQSGVMNMEQLETAITRGMAKALSTLGNGNSNENITINIGDEEVFTVVRKTAKRRGLDFARV